MKILNYGSLNIDHVYAVDSIVEPGQTIDSFTVNCYPGGKGLNQSIALARAGAKVYHAGMIGKDGQFLRKLLEENQVNCSFLRTVECNTGSAFIQVDKNGQNSIVLNGGANRKNTIQYCEETLQNFQKGDILLLQNEINEISRLIDLAYEKGLYIVLNPSPMNERVFECCLDKISLFLMNEDEASRITGQSTKDTILQKLREVYPNAEVVMTLGSRGSVYQNEVVRIEQNSFKVNAIDTTAAGDTFTGYFLAALSGGKDIKTCMALASKASAIAVTRKGASSSVPVLREVEEFSFD